MQNTAQKLKSNSPLDEMSALLGDDMAQVNALIIENMQSDVKLIPKLAEYLISAGGKRIRPLLTLASTAVFDGPMDRAYHLAAAVEFIHTATLLHDDVVDLSEERRGKKAANLVFGNQASVLVGDFLFSKAFQMMVNAQSLDVLEILSNASAVIAQGEVLQLMTTNDINTDLPAYIEVIESKTAALFAASCEVGAVLSDQPQEKVHAMRTYGIALGNAFQIIDDALDYSADQKTLGKEIGDDFKEGKMTAPVIFALQDADADEMAFWQRTLARKDQSDKDFETALGYINAHNGLEKSITLARDYAKKAKDALNVLPDSDLKRLMRETVDFTISRNF